jgi:molybdate transport repressor ModE-like protein
MEVFRAVIMLGSISAASRQLGIAQPTATNTIRRMEDILGTNLFVRAGGRLAPTRMANQIYEILAPSMSGLELLQDKVMEVVSQQYTTFRLGVSPSVSQALAPKALAHFSKKHPETRLRMDTLSLKQIRDYLWLAEGDCALTIFPIDDPMIHSHQIANIGMVCMIPITHPLAVQSSVSIEDIADESLVFFHPNTPHGKLVKEMFLARGIEPKISIETRFAETAPHLMREGFGIAFSDELTSKGVRDPDIKIVPLQDTPYQPILLHYRKDMGPRPDIDSLHGCILTAARQLGFITEGQNR